MREKLISLRNEITIIKNLEYLNFQKALENKDKKEISRLAKLNDYLVHAEKAIMEAEQLLKQ